MRAKGKPDVYMQSKIEKILNGSEDIEEKYVPPNVILFLRYLSQKMKEHELAVENKEVSTTIEKEVFIITTYCSNLKEIVKYT